MQHRPTHILMAPQYCLLISISCHLSQTSSPLLPTNPNPTLPQTQPDNRAPLNGHLPGPQRPRAPIAHSVPLAVNCTPSLLPTSSHGYSGPWTSMKGLWLTFLLYLIEGIPRLHPHGTHKHLSNKYVCLYIILNSHSSTWDSTDIYTKQVKHKQNFVFYYHLHPWVFYQLMLLPTIIYVCFTMLFISGHTLISLCRNKSPISPTLFRMRGCLMSQGKDLQGNGAFPSVNGAVPSQFHWRASPQSSSSSSYKVIGLKGQRMERTALLLSQGSWKRWPKSGGMGQNKSARTAWWHCLNLYQTWVDKLHSPIRYKGGKETWENLVCNGVESKILRSDFPEHCPTETGENKKLDAGCTFHTWPAHLSLPSETCPNRRNHTSGLHESQVTSAIASLAPLSPMRCSIITVATSKGTGSTWTSLGELLQPRQVPKKAQWCREAFSAKVLRSCHAQWTLHLSPESLPDNILTALLGAQAQLHKLWRKAGGVASRERSPQSKLIRPPRCPCERRGKKLEVVRGLWFLVSIGSSRPCLSVMNTAGSMFINTPSCVELDFLWCLG